IDSALETYRKEYGEYYAKHALKDSPRMRDASPTVVLVPGVGMFSFGRNKAESRITGELYAGAIHVMRGAGSLGGDSESEAPCTDVPQAGPAAGPAEFTIYQNYVALPPSEAFRIEYWALEEAKIQRQPPEKELSRRIVLIAGGGSGIGREVALLAAQRGAHIVVADRDTEGAEAVCDEARAIAGKEAVTWTSIDIRDRKAIRSALDATVKQFGGIDILINTAVIFPSSPSSPDGIINDAMWASALEVNVTANSMLTDEAYPLFTAQGIDASVVLTSSANAVVAQKDSQARDVSRAAFSHLVRELAVTYSPRVRVNGVSHATVIEGINPRDCAQAILFLAGPLAPATTGHIMPVDGGLTLEP
ncbi:MAG TPA: SDR family oxidoreductase, partial [Thermoanaerobaculia bacterium]